MKTRLLFLFLALLIFQPALARQRVDSPELGFSLDYPDNWVKKAANFAPLVLLYDENVTEPVVENFHLTVTRLSGNMDQSSLSRMDLMRIESDFPELKLEKSKPFTLGNLKEAHRFEFAGKHMGRDFKLLTITGYLGSTSYKLYFGAEKKQYDRQISQVESIIRSFKATP